LSDDALQAQEQWKRTLFTQYASSKSEMSLQDLRGVLSKLHVPPSRIEEVFARVDTDGDGKVSYDEFSAYVDSHELGLRTAFDAIDVDGSGSISRDELKLLLDCMHMGYSPERVDDLLRAADQNDDGDISYDEFRAAFALLDPEDLLRSLDDAASFTDDTAAMAADMFRITNREPSRVPSAAAAGPATAQSTMSATAVAQLLPGGIAGVLAQSCVQPVETVKVRLQAGSVGSAPCRYNGSIANCFRQIAQEEGIAALWKGMLPSAMRELSYSTLRFGLYRPIKVALGANTPRDTPLWKMMAAGGIAGGIASFIANPTDLLKTRMQNDAAAQPRSMLTHASEIHSLGGVAAFWRGASTTVTRAVTLGAVKMASYDSSKEVLEARLGLRKGSTPNTLGAAFITSAATVLFTAPVDFLRTQVMIGDGQRGMARIALDAVASRGPLVLWNGWLPQYMRILPYGTLQFIFMERISKLMGGKTT